MSAPTTSTTLPPQVQDYYNRRIMRFATARLVWDYFADKVEMPKKSGKQFVFSSYDPFAVDLKKSILKEGEPGEAAKIIRKEQKMEFVQIGNYVEFTDVVAMTVEDNFLNNAATALGYHYGLTRDTYIAEALNNSPSIHYCSGGVQGAPSAQNIGHITREDLAVATGWLTKAYAPKITPMDKGSDRFNSQPIREAYFCFLPTDCRNDVIFNPHMVTTTQYGSSFNTLRGELGAIDEIRFIETDIGGRQVDAQGVLQHYNAVVVSKHAYAVGTLDSVKFIVNPLGSAGSADPLGQRGSAGYKAFMGCKRIRENWIVKLACKPGNAIPVRP